MPGMPECDTEKVKFNENKNYPRKAQKKTCCAKKPTE